MDRSGSGASGGSPDANSTDKVLNASSSNNSSLPQTTQQPPTTPAQKSPSILKKIWTKIDLDMVTVILTCKFALTPVICMAAYQSDAWAKTYGALGYLSCIMGILGMPILPRAKFVQTMFINVFMVCFAAALNLLALWSAIQARKHKGPPVGYSSSQSAVLAVWLFFQIYLISTIKSSRPQLQFPVIISSIFCVISMTSGANFTTMPAAINFMVQLIGAFLTGFAVATGVSFVIFPMNSRAIMFKMFAGFLGTVGKTLKAQQAFMAKMEVDIPEPDELRDESHGLKTHSESKDTKSREHPKTKIPPIPEEAALKGALNGIIELHTKLKGELDFAKREAAYGKFDSKDLDDVMSYLRGVMLPLIGLGSVVDLIRRIADFEDWSDESRTRGVKDWQSILKVLHEPFETVTAGIQEGIQHILLRLELIDPPKKAKGAVEDPEKKGDKVSPGEPGFTAYFESKTQAFYQGREVSLRHWCEAKGLELPHESIQEGWKYHDKLFDDETNHLYLQRQLFMVLYMEYLLYRCYKAVDDMVKYADKKVEDGTMKKKRFIIPSWEILKEWLLSLHKAEHEDSNRDHKSLGDLGTHNTVALGEAFHERRDPEHLPPTGFLEKVGEKLRVIPHFFRSPHSIYGFRVAAATMSVAIIAYLKASHLFFTQQRIVWALIMVAFSMTRTAGQSTFTFVARMFGTLLAMVGSYVIWYIVDEKTPGIIVFLYIWLIICFYFLIKKPATATVAIYCAITSVLIIGYELQVRKIGVAASEKSGQPVYRLYLFAPYRLAVVVIGLLAAYVWTIFPFPVTETFAMRQDIGKCMYLCANFNSIVHETVAARVRGDGGDIHDPESPAAELEKARLAVFFKGLGLIKSLKESVVFSKWQVQVGGRFPLETYTSIIHRLERILTYSALVEYASNSFAASPYESNKNTGDIAAATEEEKRNSTSASQWVHDLRHLLRSINPTTHEITSVLCLLSSAINNGLPLPPYMRLPKAYRLTQKMEALDRDILDVKHIVEPGYSAFAVMQVASRVIGADVVALVGEVKSLVGELDFSFHAISTADQSLDYGDAASQHSNSNGKGYKKD